MSVRNRVPILILATVIAGGCTYRTPTIAHVHVGHTLAGWPDTPGKDGFFVVAEKKAQQALDSAQRATKNDNDISKTKSAIDLVVQTTNPAKKASEHEKQYGVKQALNGAVNHITFAANSDDASQNIKTSAKGFAKNATPVLERCDLITALGNDINMSSSPDEVAVLATEVLKLTRANVYGEDSDEDGIVGSNPDEYGLAQLRKELDAMLAREDPPYRTVDTWYLFNLVRLPSGEWIFRERTSGQGGYDGGY